LLSRLPFALLYALADILYGLLFYVIRYRRAVVAHNLQQAFPDRTAAERLSYARGFYHNLADLIVETIKLPSLTAAELKKRVHFTNPEVARDLIAKGPIIGTASHQCNWELLPPASMTYDIPVDSVYKQLSNPFFREAHAINPLYVWSQPHSDA